jgi:predicted dithiol-disulfide oxidoreductase (DUF899 family)
MTTTTTVGHEVVAIDAWLEAHQAHLQREKELTRLRDQLAAERRALPWREITDAYEFEGPVAVTDPGTSSLLDLFGDQEQLLVYHFMYGPDWGDEGCPSCSFWADNFDGIQVHLAHRDTAFAVVSRATTDQIKAYQARMGWNFDWYSSNRSQFNYDMGVTPRPEEIEAGTARYNHGTQDAGTDESPGISAFRRTDDGRLFLTNQVFSRGLDLVNGAYHWLDLTSKGRDEGELEWPMAWLHRHDAYEA